MDRIARALLCQRPAAAGAARSDEPRRGLARDGRCISASCRRRSTRSVLIADSYKEASIFSFYLPDHEFIYTKHHTPPATQYDFWPGYLDVPHASALWITSDPSPDALRADFPSITLVERVRVSFRGRPLRDYAIYRCETR